MVHFAPFFFFEFRPESSVSASMHPTLYMLREKFVKNADHWKLFMQSKEIICDSSFLQAIEKGILNYMYLLSNDYYLLDSLKYNKLSSLGLAILTMDMT